MFANQRELSVQEMIQKAYEKGLQDAGIRAVATPAPVFRKNAKGQPEYDSIIITMDHLMENDTGHVNTKMVLSTEDAEAALFSLFDYYGERARISALTSTLDLLVQNRMSLEKGIFLYVVPSETRDRFGNLILQVVMSTNLFAALTRHPDFGDGSEFILIQKLTEHFAKILAAINKSNGGNFPPLSYIGFEEQVAGPKEAPREEPVPDAKA